MIEHPRAAQWQYDENLDLDQKLFLSALKACLCVVSDALKMVNEHMIEVNPDTSKMVHKSSHYRWLDNNPRYKEYFLDLKSDTKDFGESQLFKLMTGIPFKKVKETFDKEGKLVSREVEESEPIPDKTAVIFFNKTRNKDLGYVERQELTTPEGIQVQGMSPIILQVNKGGDNNEVD